MAVTTNNSMKKFKNLRIIDSVGSSDNKSGISD